MRDAIDAMETVRDFERFLRDAGGLSKGLTQALISRAKIVFGREDPEPQDLEAKALGDLAARIQALAARIPQ